MTDFTTPSKAPYVIGVSGGSGSGKTYFAHALAKELGTSCELILQDSFYHDQSAQFDFDGGSVNFDHPDAIDFDLFAQLLTTLKRGQAVQIPEYDYKTHSRIGAGHRVEARPILVIDGILIFHFEKMRRLFDELIFLQTPEELRYQRRLERDVRERGRTPEGVRNQFLKQVKPMHDQFVEPCACFADQVIKDLPDYDRVLAEYVAKLRSLQSLAR